METHRGKNFLDFVQRFAAEIGGTQHFGFGFLDQIADVNDVVVLQAICRTDRQFQFVDLFQQRRVERQFRNLFLNNFFCGSSKLTKMAN